MLKIVMWCFVGLTAVAIQTDAVARGCDAAAAHAPARHAVGAHVVRLPRGNVRVDAGSRRLFYVRGAFYEPPRRAS